MHLRQRFKPGKLASILGTIFRARHSSGLVIAARWYLERVRQHLKISPGSPWVIRPRQVDFPLRVQRGMSSDLRVFEQIFVLDEYACLKDVAGVRFVMDLGANVGFSSAYFLSMFPGSRVLAVEPFRENYEAMRGNLAGYGERLLAVHGAAWPERTRVSMRAGEEAGWAKQVEEAREGDAEPIEAYDIVTLMKMARTETIDLLKVDIEGAERVVFGDTASRWLPYVRNICVELHGPDCRAVFFRTLRSFDYDLSWSGELVVCRNLRAKQQLTGVSVTCQPRANAESHH